MRIGTAHLVLLLSLSACDDAPAPREAGAFRQAFRLCHERLLDIEIDYRTLQGQAEDNRSTVQPCEGANLACIQFPLVFAVPPRLPAGPGDEVRWTVGPRHFSMRHASRGASGYVMDLTIEWRPPAGGVVVGRSAFDYDESDGVTALRVEGSGSWRRCGGRLTFEDVRHLTARLRQAGWR